MTADARPVVLFDLDGTVLDSAPGIVRSLQEAMIDVGLEPASEQLLRSDVGPPPGIMLARAGVPAALINDAVLAYRRRYQNGGLQNARVFDGLADVLIGLGRDYRLATATMKLIETATTFLAHHRIREHFGVIGGARDGVFDKAAIISATCAALGGPAAENMIMVGDRHSDITGGRANGLRTVAVAWGYGSRKELEAARPDLIIDHPEQLTEAVGQLLGRVAA